MKLIIIKNKTLLEWSKKLGISYSGMLQRYKKNFPDKKLFYKGRMKPLIKVEFDNKKMTLHDWSKYLKIPEQTIYQRFSQKLPLEELFFKGKLPHPICRQYEHNKKYDVNGKMMTRKEIADYLGIKYRTLLKRLSRGKKMSEIVSGGI